MPTIAYEDVLDQDPALALLEGSMHFERESALHKALGKIARKLDELGVDYAVAGGMAMFFHGYRRFTEDIDILVTRDGLDTIHRELEGLGYLPPFEGSKHLRDTQNGVRIEFIVTGDFPGDGKPKPVAFPRPADASTTIDDVRFLQLPFLVELKLASGMTNPGRLQDLADVQQMIRVLGLLEDFDEKLDPSVREKYRDLWSAVHQHSAENTQ